MAPRVLFDVLFFAEFSSSVGTGYKGWIQVVLQGAPPNHILDLLLFVFCIVFSWLFVSGWKTDILCTKDGSHSLILVSHCWMQRSAFSGRCVYDDAAASVDLQCAETQLTRPMQCETGLNARPM